MVGKEEVDHEHVSLLCSTQVDSPSVSLWYVLWTTLRSGHWPDERRYISNHFKNLTMKIIILLKIISWLQVRKINEIIDKKKTHLEKKRYNTTLCSTFWPQSFISKHSNIHKHDKITQIILRKKWFPTRWIFQVCIYVNRSNDIIIHIWLNLKITDFNWN